MRPRQELIDLFSTFVQFEGDRFSGWVPDGRLRRQMQQRLATVPTAAAEAKAMESAWVLYWYQHWRPGEDDPNPLVLGHLSAYLQEACYWATLRTVRKLSQSQYPMSDCFQMAIAQTATVLRRFQPNRGASLKVFAQLVFPSLLAEELRKLQVANFCTDLGLLRRVSKKRLLEALRQVGLTPGEIAQYQLAWICFKALYVPVQAGANSLPPADTNLWTQIAHLYNQEHPSQLAGAATDCPPARMERWLMQSAGWVRSYLYPPIDSLNVAKPGEGGGEWQDDLTQPGETSLLLELINQEEEQERQTQQQQRQAAIATALTQLDAETQTILQLYYQQGLTQQAIARQLQLSQAKVSRRLDKARQTLVCQSQAALNISPDPDRIEEMSAAIDIWLEIYYGGLQADAGSDTVMLEAKPS